MLNGCYLLPGAEFFVAVDGCGLWPNLTLLPNGEIAATAYDRPSHGFGCGNVGLWASADEGRTWLRRSTVSDHSDAPEAVRMNHAAGLNSQGELVVLVSGWSKGRTFPILPLQVCISADGGYTWKRHLLDAGHVPFGDILQQPDGSLLCAIHSKPESAADRVSRLYTSMDDGESWECTALISSEGNETAIVRLSDDTILAALRVWPPPGVNPAGLLGTPGLQLHASDDEGISWEHKGSVSLPGQVPAGFLALEDGSLLLTYGTRTSGLYGVAGRISRDKGRSWSLPNALITIPHRSDCGYPSSVQLKDGGIVTAYYFGPKRGGSYPHPNALPWHPRYHMGVARWKLEDFEKELAKNEG